ncbi:hypothetical protein [Novosphingobium sp. B 225]|uniref:hypothetical protein n=1 Tax=Novosphingobium sp. B 225 TaxID=1961849 RepID=UPI000B4B48AE|nr:hypothetical protein [Novosphingobium sp. B 225]
MLCRPPIFFLMGVVLLAGTQSRAAQAVAETTLAYANSNLLNDLSGYHTLSSYAISAARTKSGPLRQSVMIDPATLSTWPLREPCKTDHIAVAIDLDPGSQVFDPNDPPFPADGLANELERLRSSEISIIWSTDLPEIHEDAVRTILAATELDKDRSDTLIMATNRSTKHDQLLKLSSDFCIIAMGGDRIGDFEPAYDYLRDPNGPVATTLAANVGDGWFIISLPIS